LLSAAAELSVLKLVELILSLDSQMKYADCALAATSLLPFYFNDDFSYNYKIYDNI
jgi:hypothetical protein